MTENLFGRSHDLTCWTSQQLFKVWNFERFEPARIELCIYDRFYIPLPIANVIFWVILLKITMKITKMLEAQEYVLGREKEKQGYVHILEG